MNSALTNSRVADTIDAILALTPNVAPGRSLRRANDDNAWSRILEHAKICDNDFYVPDLNTAMTPWVFGLEILDDNAKEICGFVTLNVIFSSWNGRILYPDRLQCDNMNEIMEQQLLRILAKIAVQMDFARLTWTHVETPEWHSHGKNRPEMHGEILTLCMDQDSIKQYASESFPELATTLTSGTFKNEIVCKTINTVVYEVNSSENAKQFRLRLAGETDTSIMERLVQGLAYYVKESDAVLLSGDDYEIDGFSSDPLFYCLIVDTANEKAEMHSCGFAFFFFGYELGKGRFLHLEDLFIESEYRQNGGGSLVMATLAKISVALELSNFYWQALDWNTGALTFYQKMGAKILNGVKTSRYCSHPSNALEKFAKEEVLR